MTQVRISKQAADDLAWLAQLQQWPRPELSLAQAVEAQPDERRLRRSVAALVRVVAVGRARNLTRAQVVASLESALQATGPGQMGALERWLDHPAVQLEGKAVALQSAAQRHVVDTRVVQDVRPVFGDEEPPEARGAMVVHTLRVTHAEGGEVHDVEFALTVRDVAKLGEQCARARRQDVALRNFVGKAGLPYVPAFEEES